MDTRDIITKYGITVEFGRGAVHTDTNGWRHTEYRARITGPTGKTWTTEYSTGMAIEAPDAAHLSLIHI